MHDLPLVANGPASTDQTEAYRLRARMAAHAHRLLAEAMAKPPLDHTTPAQTAACLDDARRDLLAEMRRRYPDRTRAIAAQRSTLTGPSNAKS